MLHLITILHLEMLKVWLKLLYTRPSILVLYFVFEIYANLYIYKIIAQIHMDTPSGFKDCIPAWIKFAVQAPGEIPYNGIYYDPPPEVGLLQSNFALPLLLCLWFY